MKVFRGFPPLPKVFFSLGSKNRVKQGHYQGGTLNIIFKGEKVGNILTFLKKHIFKVLHSVSEAISDRVFLGN